jgi:hypothetical protein
MVSFERAQRVIGGMGVLLVLAVMTRGASGQIAVRNQGFVPFSDAPIYYRGDVDDPIARLQKQLDRGETTLAYEPGHGYLRAVLDRLKVPLSSQTLVFSKTSFQYRKITPQAPRALYFNDDVYVGQVHDGKVLEFISFDANQGAIFYILDEKTADHPQFQRAELDCTTCHVAATTRNVPGVLVRSISTTATGTQAPQTPSFITGHESPLSQRWGGWYVTGTAGAQAHMGATDLSPIDTSTYLAPTSDIVAHLVLAHQTQMHNLITLTNYETRLAQFEGDSAERYEKAAEELVRYLLFADEAPLTDAVKGASEFAHEFASRGPSDGKGRSLRQFDLKTRLFTYPCSYLIYSEDFDALPATAKAYVYRRLLEVLTGRDQSGEFARLTKEDRRAVLEILLATKTGLPDEWNAYRTKTKGGRT